MSSTQTKDPSKNNTDSTQYGLFGDNASAGCFLVCAALLGLGIANSPLAPTYFKFQEMHIGPLSMLEWINDVLMFLFFLLAGLSIRRQILDGQLISWGQRLLPVVAVAGGLLFSLTIYIAINLGDDVALRGWLIPCAADIVFMFGVLSLIAPLVPAYLRYFLAAFAITNHLCMTFLIALIYPADVNLSVLGGALLIAANLAFFNRFGVRYIWPYIALGGALWLLMLKSGVHTSLAGVLLAFTVPVSPETPSSVSVLHRLQGILQKPVAFLIIPIFGFANAGVSIFSLTSDALMEPLVIGIIAGLLIGKPAGVFGAVVLMVRTGLCELPRSVNLKQMLGASLLCGIGFTSSIHIGKVIFNDPVAQQYINPGALLGSFIAASAGYFVLKSAGRRLHVRR